VYPVPVNGGSQKGAAEQNRSLQTARDNLLIWRWQGM
jgi:hypothetical protein